MELREHVRDSQSVELEDGNNYLTYTQAEKILKSHDLTLLDYISDSDT